MAWYHDEERPASTEEAFSKQNLDALKPLAKLLAPVFPTRKAELVSFLARHLLQPQEARRLYEALPPLAQHAVQEATHDPRGRLALTRFEAKYGQDPPFYNPSERAQGRYFDQFDYSRHTRPTPLRLFFPKGDWIPPDLQELLRTFVPEPLPHTLPTSPEPPRTVRQKWYEYRGSKRVELTEDVPVRVRDTAREAEHDLKAVLRLVEAGRLKVTEKKQEPTAATLQTVNDVLLGGDFYTAEDRDEYEQQPAHDLAIKAFAWPMIVRAAGLAERGRGGTLGLTAAGQKALARPAHDTIRAAWKKWRGTNLLDEFSRVEVIKGQKKAGLSALAQRRKAVADALSQCPPGAWVQVDDFFRFLRATDRDFPLAHRPYELYLWEQQYGSFGYEDNHTWEQLQGRYVLAVLFEYAATLGLIDVAYLPPQGARDDFGGRWGTDDLSCLSRYDGLTAFRLNSLGAWCLDLADRYEPPAVTVARVLRVLPNLDVVATEPPLPAADRLLLERFAEAQGENVWKLTPAKLLPILEEGGSIEPLAEFLVARSGEELPQTVRTFLDDLRQRAELLRDLGPARLIECRDEALARMLAIDPQLREKCQLVGDRRLVFRAADEAAVRRALRRLGYILPPPMG
jgi:hypothetical protein